MEQTLNMLQALAEKVGTTAEYFWPKWVLYCLYNQIGISIISGLCLILGIFLTIFGCIKGRRIEWNEENPHLTASIMLVVIGCILIIIAGTTFVFNFSSLLTCIYSPEGFALKEY